MSDDEYMQLALEEARRARDAGEVPVGCVIVCGGDVVAKAGNAPITDGDPTAHAEVRAIRAAAGRLSYRLSDCTLYVSVEPCTMCAGAISQARIKRLVYGAPNPKFGAVESGVRFFEAATCHSRPEVVGGVLGDEAGELMRAFFREKRA